MTDNAPQIRFADFDDAWEQGKFGDEFLFLRNNTLSRAELSNKEGSTYDVHYGDVLIKYGSIVDPANDQLPRIASDELALTLTCDALKDGDVIIADTAEDEATGKCSELRNCGKKTVYSGLHTMPCRPVREYASGFLGHYLNTPAFHDQLIPLMQGIKVVAISKSTISDTTLTMPSLEEQARISSMLISLDNLITLHQRKHEKLLTFKKSMLEKMFPKDGATEPEIRFAGFSDPWEQRKLRDLTAEIATGKSVNSSDERAADNDVAVLKTSCVSYGTFDPRERKKVVNDEVKLVSCPVTANSLIVSRMNTPDRVGACGISSANYPNLFLPDRLWRVTFKPAADPYLLYEIIASDASQIRIRGMASGTSGSMHNVPKSSFLDMELSLPREMAEQHQIASLFRHLDTLITLHQRELDKLKTMKESLLQKMFV